MARSRRHGEHTLGLARNDEALRDRIPQAHHAVVHGYIKVTIAEHQRVRSVQAAHSRDDKSLRWNRDYAATVSRCHIQHTVRSKGHVTRSAAHGGIDGNLKARGSPKFLNAELP